MYPNRGISVKGVAGCETIAKPNFVTLSEAKSLCPKYRILRFAQNDKLLRQFCNFLGLCHVPKQPGKAFGVRVLLE